jgi:hypothetical protein
MSLKHTDTSVTDTKVTDIDANKAICNASEAICVPIYEREEPIIDTINTNDLICTVFLDEQQESILDTIEVSPIQREQIEESISSNAKLLDELTQKKFDSLGIEESKLSPSLVKSKLKSKIPDFYAQSALNFKDPNLIAAISNIFYATIKYPVFSSMLKNIAEDYIRFDIENSTEHCKKNSTLRMGSFFYNIQRFSDILSCTNQAITSKTLETIKKVLKEISKDNSVSVSVIVKGCKDISQSVHMFFISSEEISEKQDALVTEIMREANIVSTFLEKYTTKEEIRTLIVTSFSFSKCSYSNFMSVLFGLCELSKIIEEKAKTDKEKGSSKLTLFYKCEIHRELLNILSSIAKEYFKDKTKNQKK